jgi:hypothetical protein
MKWQGLFASSATSHGSDKFKVNVAIREMAWIDIWIEGPVTDASSRGVARGVRVPVARRVLPRHHPAQGNCTRRPVREFFGRSRRRPPPHLTDQHETAKAMAFPSTSQATTHRLSRL